MISVEDAMRLILSKNSVSLGGDLVSLSASEGHVLSEDVACDRDLPPFDRVAMDGIAVRYAEFEQGRRVWRVEGIQAAGEPAQEISSQEGVCLEIMTGAVMAKGVDMVIPYERVTIEDGHATVDDAYISEKWKNVHRQGSDARKGQLAMRSGTKIGVPEISALASLGYAKVPVKSQARVGIFTTGNEIVDVGDMPEPHQIRRSNAASIRALLKRRGYTVSLDRHLGDQAEQMFMALKSHIEKLDVLILTGGVSKGKFDYVPAVLKDLGVECCFHRVAQKPGKPLWFGTKKGLSVFALPGNPVSSLVCLRRYVIPYLQHLQTGRLENAKRVLLGSDVSFRKDLSFFKIVQESGDSCGTVDPVTNQGSGDFFSLLKTDGFVELPQGRNVYSQGLEVSYYAW